MKLVDRLETLTRISGLSVSVYQRDGVNYFVFGPINRPLKTVCTYPKVKLFAEGFAAGRSYES
jgi:hypothetical protein